jgi:hypothetical protein
LSTTAFVKNGNDRKICDDKYLRLSRVNGAADVQKANFTKAPWPIDGDQLSAYESAAPIHFSKEPPRAGHVSGREFPMDDPTVAVRFPWIRRTAQDKFQTVQRVCRRFLTCEKAESVEPG